MENFENLNEINPLVEKLIEELGFKDLPESELNDFRESMAVQINRRLGLIVLENLNEEGLDEYEKIMNEELPDPDKITELTRKYIPDLEEKVSRGMDEFFKDVLQAYSK